MKLKNTYALLLVLLAGILPLYSQKNKKVTTYYYKKLKSSEGYLLNGQKNGTWVYWLPHGELRTIETWKNGKKEGVSITYQPKSRLDSLITVTGYTTIQNLYKLSLKRQKKPVHGYKLRETQYVNGHKNGFSRTWFDSCLIMESHYVNDTLDGEYKEYRLTKKGEPQIIRKLTTYRMGIYHGKFIDYSKGEQYVTEGTYVNGRKDGFWKEFENTVFYESNYTNGKLHGKQSTFNLAHKPLAEKEYKNGVPDGPFTEYVYNEPGVAEKTTGRYADGEQTGMVRVYHNDVLYSEYGVYTGVLNGPHRTYYGNGKVLREGEYVFGMINGCWNLYNSQGIKEGSECFDHGELVAFDYFHLNGKKAATSVRDKNGIHHFTEFYYSGKKRMEILKFKPDQPVDYILTTWNDRGKKLSYDTVLWTYNVVTNPVTPVVIAPLEPNGYIYPSSFEVIPTFKGGSVTMNRYIAKNLQYPAEAKEKGLEGIVFAEFTIELNGKISGITIISSPHESLSKEALRLLDNIGLFVPGSVRGQRVRSKYQVEIPFKL